MGLTGDLVGRARHTLTDAHAHLHYALPGSGLRFFMFVRIFVDTLTRYPQGYQVNMVRIYLYGMVWGFL